MEAFDGTGAVRLVDTDQNPIVLEAGRNCLVDPAPGKINMPQIEIISVFSLSWPVGGDFRVEDGDVVDAVPAGSNLDPAEDVAADQRRAAVALEHLYQTFSLQEITNY